MKTVIEFRRLKAAGRHSVKPTQTRLSSISKPVIQGNTDSSNCWTIKQTLVASTYRPKPAGRDHYPI